MKGVGGCWTWRQTRSLRREERNPARVLPASRSCVLRARSVFRTHAFNVGFKFWRGPSRPCASSACRACSLRMRAHTHAHTHTRTHERVSTHKTPVGLLTGDRWQDPRAQELYRMIRAGGDDSLAFRSRTAVRGADNGLGSLSAGAAGAAVQSVDGADADVDDAVDEDDACGPWYLQQSRLWHEIRDELYQVRRSQGRGGGASSFIPLSYLFHTSFLPLLYHFHTYIPPPLIFCVSPLFSVL